MYYKSTVKIAQKLLRRAHLSNCQLSIVLKLSIAVSTMKLANSEKKPLFFRIPISSQCQGTETEEGETGEGSTVHREIERGKRRNRVWWASVPSLSLSLRLFDGREGIDGWEEEAEEEDWCCASSKPPRKRNKKIRLGERGELFLYKSASVNADEVCRKQWGKIFVC